MNPKRFGLLFVLFVVSGFCGLLYQTVWIRLAFANFGVVTPVLSVVVSVFMAGLALGSWISGRWVDNWSRWSGWSAIILYSFAEFLIGIGAFAVPTLFTYGEALLRPTGEMASASYLFLSATVITVVLIPWCTLMGTTFPLVAAYIKERNQNISGGFSYLYLANVIGGLAGVLITALILIELMGFQNTLVVAGLLNFAIGLVALILALESRRLQSSSIAQPDDQSSKGSISNLDEGEGLLSLPCSRPMALVILFATGFIAMAMEVIWIRTFTPILSTTIYSFASLLAAYLAGTWIGTLAYKTTAKMGWRPRVTELMALLAISSCLPLLFPDPNVAPEKWVALISIFPVTALLGYLTPRLIDEYSSGTPNAVGNAYAWNVLGSILGPLAAGYLLLPTLGAKGSLLLLTLPFLGFYVLIGRGGKWRKSTLTAGAFSVLVLSYVAVNSSTFEDGSLYKKVVVRRDHTATVISATDFRQRLLVNGTGITHKSPIIKMMGHLPMAFHADDTKNSLVICFGMGTTFRSLASWGQNVTAVELVPSVVDAFDYYFEDAKEVLSRPNVDVIIDDGRRFLRRTDLEFDVITIDPPPPEETAGSSLLYSFEFYEVLKKRLAPDGIVHQWYPGKTDIVLESITGALVKAFPHVRVFISLENWGYHILASREPFPERSLQELVDRVPSSAWRDMEEWLKPEIPAWQLFAVTLQNEIPVEKITNPANPKLWISDDRPINEYFFLRTLSNDEPTQ